VWTLTSLKRLLRKIDASVSTDRKCGSRRKHTVRTAGNVEVEEMSKSQETAPGSHCSLLCIKLLERSVFQRQRCTTSFVRVWNWNASERLANTIMILNWIRLHFCSVLCFTVLYLGGALFGTQCIFPEKHVIGCVIYLCRSNGERWRSQGCIIMRHEICQQFKWKILRSINLLWIWSRESAVSNKLF